MYQFFVKREQVREDRIVILGPDVNHIGRVLRMRPGERVRISDETGASWFCTIAEIGTDEVWTEVESADDAGTELPCRIVLYQGLPKSDKLELIIQKATELGAAEIVPVAMKNCVVKLNDSKKIDAKVKRWQAIAESAAKQSKRSLIPEVKAPVTWKEALRQAEELDVVLVPYENERGMEATRSLIGKIQKGQSVAVMIGPEGGFAPEEINMIPEENGKMHRISLGRRILRTETAGLAALSMLVYCLDQ